MARGIGIEITSTRVSAAAVDASPRKTRLLAFHEEQIPPSPDDKPGEGLMIALRAIAQKIQGGRIAVGFDSGDAIIREVTLPFKGEEQIRKTVAFELESLIHNYSIEDLVVDTLKTGETEKSTTLLATAVPKKLLAARLKELEAAGIDPTMVDLDMAALFNAWQQTGGVVSDEPFLIVYGTTRFTKILLVEGKRPRSLRTIRLSIPTRERVETERHEKKKLQETALGETPSPVVVVTESEMEVLEVAESPPRSEMIEILAKEISRFLLASASTSSPTHAFLTGDYDNEEAAAMLETALSIPVKIHDPLASIDHALLADQVGWVSRRIGVALGLALKAAEVDSVGLDFRRGEFAFKGKFEGLKTSALVGLELVIVLLAVLGLHFYLGWRTQSGGYEGMLKMQGELYASTMKKEIDDPAKAYGQLAADQRKMATDQGGGEHPIERSALELWNQVIKGIDQFALKYQVKQLGDQKMYLMVDVVDVKQITLTGSESIVIVIRGTIQNEEYASELRQEIRAVEPFKGDRWELTEGGYTPTADGRKRFGFTIRQARKG